MTKYVALGGAWNYDIRPFLPRSVASFSANAWVGRHKQKIERYLDCEKEDVILIGFSAGAVLALELSHYFHNVKVVHAHSPILREHEVLRSDLSIHLYVTEDDRTPSFKGTKEVEKYYRDKNMEVFSYEPLKKLPWPSWFKPKRFQRQYTLAQKLNHQFHNIPLTITE